MRSLFKIFFLLLLTLVAAHAKEAAPEKVGIILDELGLSYDMANDGLEACDAFSKNSYDLVMMDEDMPHMNGIEATRKIRSLEAENNRLRTPVIAGTANVFSDDRERFMQAGMDEHLPKPFTAEEVEAVLRKFLTEVQS